MRPGHPQGNRLSFIQVCLMLSFILIIGSCKAVNMVSSDQANSNQTSISPTTVSPGSPIDCTTAISTFESTMPGMKYISNSPFNTGDYDQMGKYITPDDRIIKEILLSILRDNKGLNSDDTLRDWVASNIVYDTAEAGDPYNITWQFPEETLTLGTGVCIDYSTLLCSLLRANGVPSDQVYIAIAYKKNLPQTPASVHAFLVRKYDSVTWSIIEPQRNTQAGQLYADRSDSLGFDIVYCFNDKTYFKGSPKIQIPD
jgi:hypothetical protein